MPREINFLSDRHKDILKQEEADKKIMLYAAIVLGICFFLFVVTTSIQIYFSYQLTQTKLQQEALRKQIIGDQDTERSFVIFVHKLSDLAQLDQERQDKKAIIQYFNSAFGSNISLTGVKFDQNEKLLTLSLQSPSVFELKQIIPRLGTPELLQKFSSVHPSHLTRTQDGKYQVDVVVSTVSPKI